MRKVVPLLHEYSQKRKLDGECGMCVVNLLAFSAEGKGGWSFQELRERVLQILQLQGLVIQGLVHTLYSKLMSKRFCETLSSI